MGRPTKNNLDYFSHDNNMRNDKKILAIRNKFDNMLGYGLYNCMLEALSEEDLLQIPYDDSQISLLAGDFRVDESILINFIEYALSINCIQLEEGFLRCSQLEKRGKVVFEKRGRELLQLRVSGAEMPVIREFLEQKLPEIGVSAPVSTQSIVKKRKEKKSIEKESKNKTPLDFAFDKFREMRKKIKKPMTDRAEELVWIELNKLAGDNDELKIAILEKSTRNNWQDVYEIKNKPNFKGQVSKQEAIDTFSFLEEK